MADHGDTRVVNTLYGIYAVEQYEGRIGWKRLTEHMQQNDAIAIAKALATLYKNKLKYDEDLHAGRKTVWSSTDHE